MANPAWQGPWFAANSPWNIPIPPTWASHVHPDTAPGANSGMVQGVYIANASTTDDIHAFAYRPTEMQAKLGPSGLTSMKWAGPGMQENIIFVPTGQPLITVYNDYNPSTKTYIYRNATVQVPLPANWTGYNSPGIGTGYFERRTVIYCQNGDMWVVYQPTPPGDPIRYLGTQTDTFWHCTCAIKIVGGWAGANPFWGDGVGRGGGGSGFPPGPGCITPFDFLNTPTGGHFNHALAGNVAFAADGSYTSPNPHPKFVYPAEFIVNGLHPATDGKTQGITGIPHGARIFLDPSMTDSDLIALGVTKEWQLKIARTLQAYGMMSKESVVTQGGAGGIISESTESVNWNKAQGYYPSTFQWPWQADGTTDTSDKDTSTYNAAFPAALLPTSGSRWKVMNWNDNVPGITAPGATGGGGGGGGGGAAGFVQEIGHATPANPGSTYALAVANAPTAGDLVVLSAAWNDVTNTLSSVTDSKGNTWTVDAQVAGATTSESVAVASTLQNIGALTTADTITLHFSGSVTVHLTVAAHEFSGCTKTIDRTATNNGNTGTTRDAGTTAATTNANDLVFAAFGVNGIETAFTVGASYTSPAPGFYAQTGSSLEFEYQIVSATGAQHPSGTGGLSFKSIGVTVVYKAAAASNPVNTVAPAVTGTTTVGSTLTATSGTWTDDGSPTFSYQWAQSPNGTTGWVNLAGGSTYVVAPTDSGQFLRCVVTDSDSTGVTSANSNVVGAITGAGAAPVNTVAPAVTGTAVVGSTLTTTNGTWTDNGAPTFTYQWQRDNFGDSNYVDIFNVDGAHAAAYVLADEDDGCHLRCVVTNTDVLGATSANSNAAGLITEPAPVNVVSPTVSGPASAGSTLAVNPGTWQNMGGLNPLFTYQWTSNGVDIPSATSQNYITLAAHDGDSIGCKVTAHNTGGVSLPAASPNTVIVSVPSVTDFSIMEQVGGGPGGQLMRNVLELTHKADGSLSPAAVQAALASAEFILSLPTVDPHVAGRLWSNGGVVTVSQG